MAGALTNHRDTADSDYRVVKLSCRVPSQFQRRLLPSHVIDGHLGVIEGMIVVITAAVFPAPKREVYSHILSLESG